MCANYTAPTAGTVTIYFEIHMDRDEIKTNDINEPFKFPTHLIYNSGGGHRLQVEYVFPKIIHYNIKIRSSNIGIEINFWETIFVCNRVPEYAH
jgi:hypothetical protein